VLIIGFVIGNRPIVWIGAAVALVGLLLLFLAAPGPFAGSWY
jgi:hypothetical protein